MSDIRTNRKNRRAARRTKPAAIAGVALAATALTAAIAPPATPATSKLDVLLAANAEPVTPKNVQPAITVGLLGGLIPPLINALGVANPYQLPLPLIPGVVGPIAWDFVGGAPSTQGIYNLINNLVYTDLPVEPYSENGYTCKGMTQDKCRTAFLIATDYGTLGANDAIRGLIDQAEGKTPLNFDPLKPNPSGTGLTQVSGIFLNNILRTDGGFDSRFPMLVEPFGVSATMPPTGEFGPNSNKASVYNSLLSATWAYNTLADYPVTFSPLAMANAVFGAVPPPSVVNDLLGILQAPDKPAAAAKVVELLTKTAGTLNATADGENVTFGFCPDANEKCAETHSGVQSGVFGLFGLADKVQGSFAEKPDLPGVTIGDEDLVLGAYNAFLPLTAPLYVNSTLVNSVLKAVKSPYLLGTPEADILTPALKILINSAYTDVITPDKLDTVNPYSNGFTYAQQGYEAYDRTFYQPASNKPVNFQWSGNPALTPDEQAAVNGDAATALTDAFKAQAEKPFFGIIVANPDAGTPINPPATPAAASAPAAEPVVDVPAEDPAPAVEVSAPATGGGSDKGAAAEAGDHDNGGGHTRAARTGRG